jgi:hypothetical protein
MGFRGPEKVTQEGGAESISGEGLIEGSKF